MRNVLFVFKGQGDKVYEVCLRSICHRSEAFSARNSVISDNTSLCHSQQFPWRCSTGIFGQIYRHEITIKSPKRVAKRRVGHMVNLRRRIQSIVKLKGTELKNIKQTDSLNESAQLGIPVQCIGLCAENGKLMGKCFSLKIYMVGFWCWLNSTSVMALKYMNILFVIDCSDELSWHCSKDYFNFNDVDFENIRQNKDSTPLHHFAVKSGTALKRESSDGMKASLCQHLAAVTVPEWYYKVIKLLQLAYIKGRRRPWYRRELSLLRLTLTKGQQI